jgi:hypothetical protein
MNYCLGIYYETQENIDQSDIVHFHVFYWFAFYREFFIEVFLWYYFNFRMTFDKVFSKIIPSMDFLHYQNTSNLKGIHMLSFSKMG